MREAARRALIIATGIVVTLAMAVVAVRPSQGIALPRLGLGLWTNVWTDSFTGAAGTGVNTQYWKYDVGQGIFGTNEIETMTSSTANVHLDGNGDLDITALDNNGNWTSGRIQTTSSGFAAPANGELTVSASIEQPATGLGSGYWPAFWLLGPGQWPGTGEIDIMEDVDSLSEHSGTLHCGNLTSQNSDGTLGPCHEFNGISSYLQTCSGCQTGYHVYSMTVDRRDPAAEQISWSLDGHTFFTVNESQIPQAVWTAAVDHGFSIIFDLAMGGNFPNAFCTCWSPTDATASGGTMSVQYVSVEKWTPFLTLNKTRQSADGRHG